MIFSSNSNNLFLYLFALNVQACDALLNDHETKDLLNSTFDLMILDGAYPGVCLQSTSELNSSIITGLFDASQSVP
jgi:hypothetical protein